MKVKVLGCGASGGVPVIGDGWGRCDPAEPRNRRRRCSVLVQSESTTILIDTSPDLREQLIDAGVERLDAVVMTHAHADHLHGMDDLRAINRLMAAPIPLFADAATLQEIGQRFGYALEPITGVNYYRPCLSPHEIVGPFAVGPVRIVPFLQDHGFSKSLGFRAGGFAYSTDVTELDGAAFAAVAGAELWIVDCLRREPHPTHSHLAKSLAWIARARPRRAVLTHMDHTMDYRELCAELPPDVEPGWDGLTITIPER